MERHKFPFFIPAPYSLPPPVYKGEGSNGGRGTNQRRKNKNLRLTAKGSSETVTIETRKHDFLPKEDLKDSGHKTFSGVRWEHEAKPRSHGDGEGEG